MSLVARPLAGGVGAGLAFAFCMAFFAAGPLCLEVRAQDTTAALRGVLVRLPDAGADVSVTWPSPEGVPDGFWDRLGGETVVFVSGGSPDVEARVREILRSHPSVDTPGVVEDESRIGATGIVFIPDGGVRLVWKNRPEAVAIELLGEARSAVDDFELTVRMPHSGVIGDMWGLQAELSRAGIRRVRFVAGS